MIVSPDRVSRSQRGEAADTFPAQPGHVVGEVPLHPHAVASGDHHRRVRRPLAGAGLDDDPGLGPRLHAGRHARRRVLVGREPAAGWSTGRSATSTRTVMLPLPASGWRTK